MDILLPLICIIAASISLIIVFSIKGKPLSLLTVRLLFSAVLIALMAVLKILPFNFLIVTSTGLLGAPGLIASLVIVRFL